jgi:hypothetical protein
MKWTAQRQHDVLEGGYWKHLHRVRVSWIFPARPHRGDPVPASSPHP